MKTYDPIEFTVQRETPDHHWQTLSEWNSLFIARNRALEEWEKEPESRPSVRVIRKGAVHVAYMFAGGFFQRVGGRWRRVLVRRMRK